MNINNLTKKQKNLLLRVIAAAVMLVVLYLLPLEEYPVLRFVLFMIPYLTVGNDVLRKAWKGIRNHQVFDECFLMAVATIGAMILGEYTEAVAVMLFYQIGELFQSIAVGKSRRSISELMDIRPDYANLEQDGEVEKVDPDEVEVGSIIVIRPGEKVPIDGVVVEGISSLNTSALTGESLPRDVKPGDEIISGSVNISGLLRVETTKEFDESTASKILELVENAGERKAKSEQFISKFARWYTPAVCYGALALAILGPLVNILVFHKTSDGALWSDWIYRALTFLVISCPCAIVVSVPLSFFGGIGGASREGILIKGSNFMETLANVKYMVMDKTGTITKGNFEVTAVHDGGDQNMDPTEILELAAHAEGHSTHPIAVSIRRAYEKDGRALDMNRVTNVQEISGKGLVATLDGMQIAAGNLKLMEQLGVRCEPCRRVGTVVYVAKKEAENPAAAGLAQFEYIGHVLISDEIKPTSAEAIRAMKKAGVMKTVMLTGDITSTTTPTHITVNDVNAASTTFTFYGASQSNWFGFTNFTITLTKSFPLNVVGAASHATLYLPFDVTTTGATKAYYVGTANNGYAQLTATDNEGTEIPANTAVVLVNSDADGSTTLTKTTGLSAVVTESANLLKGTLVPMSLDLSDETPYYSLGKLDGEIGFYKFTDGTITLGANKAYLEVPAAGGVKGFALGFGDEDGILELNGNRTNETSEWYNLAGQRVRKPTRGVYIVNGKKVTVK